MSSYQDTIDAGLLPAKEGNRFWPLPPDYCSLTDDGKRSARVSVCTSWYDKTNPGQLMRSPEMFLMALKLFVDVYIKQAKVCRHQYFMPDCRHKPVMQKMFTHPRSALVAPRESAKTFTVIFEMAPFMAITRPNTPGLIGSETVSLTKEKIKEIRRRVEDNGLIYRDFGQVWPMGRTGIKDWNNECLDFHNGSNIQGSSIDQATRGRHPLWGLIDDPEGKRARNPKWRDDFMKWLFHDYLNQFRDKGTNVMWIGTLLTMDSCLWRAVHNEDDENRFVGWKRSILPMVFTDEKTNKLASAWPEKLSVEEFERKKRGVEGEDGSVTVIGMAAIQSEFQGDPIPSGDRMFNRDLRKNGYVLWEDGAGERQVYNPATGNSILLENLKLQGRAYMGVDIADTPGSNDESAIVVFVVDHDFCCWIVDCWSGQVFSDQATDIMFRMADKWSASECGWESVSLGNRIYREAYKVRNERLKQGFHVPHMSPITTQGVRKELRIERMRPAFEAGRIKLPVLEGIDGYTYCRAGNRNTFRKMINQFDTMTGEGCPGRDDLIDACEMAHRVIRRAPTDLDRRKPGQRILDKWEAKGFHVNPMLVPQEFWTKRQQAEFDARITPESIKRATRKERPLELFG